MKTKFAVGDIVRLKSGGPNMTIEEVPEERGGWYRCQWFAGKKLSDGVFYEPSLEGVSNDEG